MQKGEPSRTALGAAITRAMHIRLDRPALLHDPYAVTILGPVVAEALQSGRADEQARDQTAVRAVVVARTLFAEETLAKAVERGIDQYALLGAGLDTFAYRNPWPSVRVFEVDHPATGAWKQAALNAAQATPSGKVVYASVDFERETVLDGLARAGFDAAKPAVFAWLGVVVYLTREAIAATLRAVATLPKGTEIVFEYGEPRESLPDEARQRMAARMEMLKEIGEPWISFFTPEDMEGELRAARFAEIEDLSGGAINARWFADRDDNLKAARTSHLVRARV